VSDLDYSPSHLLVAVYRLEIDYGITPARGYAILTAAALPEVMETRLSLPDETVNLVVRHVDGCFILDEVDA
jgi:hypothetical protein